MVIVLCLKTLRKSTIFLKLKESIERFCLSLRDILLTSGGGVSALWKKLDKPCYDELVMDDICVGFSNFHVTKEKSGIIGPYHYDADTSKTYRKMKRIYYTYRDGALYRCFLFDGDVCKEEVAYVHFQKRNMSVSTDYMATRFDIINNEFTDYRILDAGEQLNLVKADTIRDFYVKAKEVTFKIKVSIKNH